ncbi:hypothetical protein OSTOST_09322 [Ostertagia ostertagi]
MVVVVDLVDIQIASMMKRLKLRPRLVLKPRTTDPAELEAKRKREAEEEAARRAKLFQEVKDFSDGCGAKFNIVVVSDAFIGKRVIECHR